MSSFHFQTSKPTIVPDSKSVLPGVPTIPLHRDGRRRDHDEKGISLFLSTNRRLCQNLKRNLQGVPDITCKGTDREVKNTMPPATAGTSLQARQTYFVVAGSNGRRVTFACEDNAGKVAGMRVMLKKGISAADAYDDSH